MVAGRSLAEGVIMGGNAGQGAVPRPGGAVLINGWDIRIRNDNPIDSTLPDPLIRGGHGRGDGGDVRLSAKHHVEIRAYTLVLGGDAGDGTSSRGGSVRVVAMTKLTSLASPPGNGEDVPDNAFRGIRGGKGSDLVGMAEPGEGGGVTLISFDELINEGFVRGGNAGFAGPNPPPRNRRRGASSRSRPATTSSWPLPAAPTAARATRTASPAATCTSTPRPSRDPARARSGAGEFMGPRCSPGSGPARRPPSISGSEGDAVLAEEDVCLTAEVLLLPALNGGEDLIVVESGVPGSIGLNADLIVAPTPVDELTQPPAMINEGCPGAGAARSADLDHDGRVDGADLAVLITLLGKQPGSTAADLNMDGVIDLSDLAQMLAAWASP
jgi:hypothetical protein